jgi:DNA-binding response OmpR family regulator
MTIVPAALVIDDDPVIREFFRLKLEAKGWSVQEANSAAVGYTMFQHTRPNLVMLDLVMSSDEGLDSMHLARLVKDESPDVTLLVITGLGSKKDIKHFMREHDIELYGKSSKDPYFQMMFARIDVLCAEVNQM